MPTTTQPACFEDLSHYMPLVRQTAAGFFRRLPCNVAHDDILAAGALGLVDSLRRSSPARGPAFEAYARIRIRGAIIDELRSQDWLGRGERSRVVAQDAGGAPAAVTGVIALDDLPGRWPSFFPGNLPTPLDAAERGRARDNLVRALDTALVAREREILVSYYFEGTDFKEIADRLGVSAARVSQLHSQALDKLRAAMLSDECVAAA